MSGTPTALCLGWLEPPASAFGARTWRRALVLAAGALLVVSADLVARSGLAALGGPATELPVGAVTAVLGAPVLLWLLRSSVQARTA